MDTVYQSLRERMAADEAMQKACFKVLTHYLRKLRALLSK
jgi:hypothetical protein